MQFIEALKLRSKLFFLFVLITFGLVSIGVVGTLQLNSMKENIDKVYFGSLVPVTELHEILQTYNNGLQTTIYRASRLKITPNRASLEIASELKEVQKKWHSYESHYKRDDEKNYLSYASLEIKGVNNYFSQIYKVAHSGKDLSRININELEKKVFFINGVLQKLISYEVEVAQHERKMFLQGYSQSKMYLSVVLGAIILAILSISLYVFRSIQNDQRILESMTEELKKANKKLENITYTDTLTSLYNRRYFNLIYEKEFKRAKRANSHITFMMVDIDFFKQYNDTYGHLEGDNALKAVAKVLQETLQRPSDYVFRLGGEEFGVLLSETNEPDSTKLAETICDAVRAREIEHKNSSVNEFVTISIGVICCVADDTLDDKNLLNRADEMLYEAKGSGRNRCVVTTNISSDS